MLSNYKRIQLLAALSLPIATAFQDASPFILYSSSKFEKPSGSSQIATTAAVSSIAQNIIKLCASEAYILVQQPGAHASDFASPEAAPTLYAALQAIEGSSFTVDNVHGKDGEAESLTEILARYAEETCDAEVEEVDAKTASFGGFDDMKPKVIRVDFAELPIGKKARMKALRENDSFLQSIISLIPTSKYTLIYTATPLSTQLKVSSAPSSELRRRDDHENTTLPAIGTLFSRYQFFTPGIFMGYLVGFFLLAILYVGISSVSSLTVTYGAFEKEMGPAAQKKQQ
ncbi:vacuolar ATP synthase subunit S1-domain-containing protein [Tuber borchii]|uniref:Protein BIG1 n=1 Tax=Tuber borchii TaxID=42251 RepID=A0A2T6ZYW6_TUBBO|nr:vacuolar ATP synthase subunit S1-domain-containing protein [Tuber borchii]